MAAINQEPIPLRTIPVCVEGPPHYVEDLAYIEMNLPTDPAVALLVCQLAPSLFDEMKAHISRHNYSPHSSHPIFTITKISPEKFFAQVLEARIKNKPLIEDIKSTMDKVSLCGMSWEKISVLYSSTIRIIQQTMEMPRIEKAHSLPVLEFQYYVAKTLAQKQRCSDLGSAISELCSGNLTTGKLSDIDTFTLHVGKIREIRASLLDDGHARIEREARKEPLLPYRESLSQEEWSRQIEAEYIVRYTNFFGGTKDPKLDEFATKIKADPLLESDVLQMDFAVIPMLLGNG